MGDLFVEMIIFEMLLMNLINDRINTRNYKICVSSQLILLLNSGIIGIAFILASYLLALNCI